MKLLDEELTKRDERKKNQGKTWKASPQVIVEDEGEDSEFESSLSRFPGMFSAITNEE